MKTELKTGLSYLPVALFGGCLGGIGGWLTGRFLFFLLAELPNRHLPPEQFVAETCGLNLSIGMLTFLILMPLGLFAGAGFSIKFWKAL